jgi:predicted nucleotide-binding protein
MPKAAIESRVQAILAEGSAQPATTATQIFVVHGRDHEARDQLRLILFSLRLEPFVLQVTGGGATR